MTVTLTAVGRLAVCLPPPAPSGAAGAALILAVTPVAWSLRLLPAS
jgi:hypothetical protein